MDQEEIEPVSYRWVGPTRCQHIQGCVCDLEAIFVAGENSDLIWVRRTEASSEKTNLHMIEELKRRIHSRYEVRDGKLLGRIRPLSDSEMLKIDIQSSGNTNIRFVHLNMGSLPLRSITIKPMDPAIISSVMNGEVQWFASRGLQRTRRWFEQNVWRPYPRFCPDLEMKIRRYEKSGTFSLLVMAAREVSGFNAAFGMNHGRPHVISALENLSGEKIRQVMMSHSRPSDVMTDGLRKVLENVPNALDLMYEAWGLTGKINTQPAKLDPVRMEGMYFGASAGKYFENAKEFDLGKQDGVRARLIRKMGAQSIHAHTAVMERLKSYVKDGEPLPPSISVTNVKNEFKFSRWEKQKDAASFAKWKMAARTYEIVDKLLVEMERLTMTNRSVLEKSGPRASIAIGSKWTEGGAQHFMNYFKVKYGEEWKRAAGDGDIDKLDQSIHYIWLQFFVTMGGVYTNSNHPDYQWYMDMVAECAKRLSVRLVHFFADLWAIVVGKMPSGAWMTSHGDSWIMALWYFLFLVMEVASEPDLKKRSQLMEQALEAFFKVYGDDSISAADRLSGTYLRFNYENFNEWLQKYLIVRARDVRKDVEWCASVRNGRLNNDSIVFLKQYIIRNRQDGATRYLPFRPIDEYQMKAVWGREPKARDIYDFMMSILGNAYGTNGTNYEAWWWLRCVYLAACEGRDTELSLKTVQDRVNQDSSEIKKWRMKGIHVNDLVNGYPSWANLVSRNEFDPAVHCMPVSDWL